MQGETSKKLIGPVAYHRNGISGQGFHVALVEETDERETRRMVVLRCKDSDELGSVHCFALDVDKAAAGDVQFFTNSWRGDQYADFMDNEIDKHDREIMAELERRKA